MYPVVAPGNDAAAFAFGDDDVRFMQGGDRGVEVGLAEVRFEALAGGSGVIFFGGSEVVGADVGAGAGEVVIFYVCGRRNVVERPLI